MREQYNLSRHIHTSILDLDEITPKERQLLLKFLAEETKAIREQNDKIMNKKGNK